MYKKSFDNLNFFAIFSQKFHGDMSLFGGRGNRKKFCETYLKFPAISAEQPRGSRIKIVDSSYSPDVPVAGADALITQEKNLGLIIGMADCPNVVLMDPVGRTLANVHAGRQGVAYKIIPKTVAVMERLKSKKQNVRVLIGPGICGKCYEVGKEEALEWGLGIYQDYISDIEEKPDKCLINLRGIIEHQLIAEAGIKKENIEHIDICTFEDINYFSYRRAIINGKSGLVARQKEKPTHRGICVAAMEAA